MGTVEGAFVKVVVPADVARLLSQNEFLFVGEKNRPLNFVSTFRVDRVGDVCIELGSSGLVASGFKEIQRRAALIAERGAQRVLPLAAWTAHHDLSAGHGDKRAGGAVDELQVANDETVIERYTAECLKPLYGFIDEFDANFCNFHVVISLARYIKSFDRTTSLHPWDFSVSAAVSASASDSYIPK